MSLITITEKGVIAPTTVEVVDALWEVFINAFGSDLTQDTATPQGQLVVSTSAIYQDALNKFVQMLNMFDPQYSEGIYQEALAQIYFINRKQKTYSTATVTFSGLNGVVIPVGFQVQDINGNLWQTTSSLTIDTSGKITGTVQAVTGGAISASPNTITTIVKALSGLDSVTNTISAVIGSDVQNATDFEIMRSESVEANAKLTDGAVRGAVANIADVRDVWVKSNFTGETVTMGSTAYSVAPHTILCSVQGGSDADVAWQLLVKAGSGCGFAGNTTVKVYDTDTYSQDAPDYNVTFLRPTAKDLYFKIAVEDLTAVSSADATSAKTAILSALGTGNTRARIGTTITALRYYSAINTILDTPILYIQVSRDNTNFVSNITFGVDEFPTSSDFNIQFVQG